MRATPFALGKMPRRRPPIPREIQRPVLVEDGRRCAIPTCRSTPVELAHIGPGSKFREHRFENFMALCPTCHIRYVNDSIDRSSVQRYKLQPSQTQVAGSGRWLVPTPATQPPRSRGYRA